jgi:hypothetical protein
MQQVSPILRRIATVSVIMGVVLYSIVQAVLDVPPVLMPLRAGAIATVVGAFWLYFERIGWRQRAFRLWGWLCDYPDLNGRWVGTVDRQGEGSPHAFVMEIRQTYLRITVNTFSANSRGTSLTAALITDELRDNFRLIETWTCRTKKPGGLDAYEDFTGTSVIDISSSGADRFLDDHYFTRRHPQTQGNLKLTYAGPHRLNRFQ